MCKKIIINKFWYGHSKRQCTKPEYKDGLCKYHYDRMVSKSTLYKDREGYREPTLNEMKSGKLIYFKNNGSYGGHRYHKGIITIGDNFRPTNIKPNPELFVIRIKM